MERAAKLLVRRGFGRRLDGFRGLARCIVDRTLEPLPRGWFLLRRAADKARHLEADVARRGRRGLILRLEVSEVHHGLGGAAAELVVSAVVPLEEKCVGVRARVQDLVHAPAEAGDETAAAVVGGLAPAELADLAGPVGASHPLLQVRRRHLLGLDERLVHWVRRSRCASFACLLFGAGLHGDGGRVVGRGRQVVQWRCLGFARRRWFAPRRRWFAGLAGHRVPAQLAGPQSAELERDLDDLVGLPVAHAHHPVVRADLVDDITLRHCSTSMPQCRAAPICADHSMRC